MTCVIQQSEVIDHYHTGKVLHMDYSKGRIDVIFEAFCGRCNDVLHPPVTTRKDAVRWLKDQGWKKIRQSGWTCDKCKQYTVR